MPIVMLMMVVVVMPVMVTVNVEMCGKIGD